MHDEVRTSGISHLINKGTEFRVIVIIIHPQAALHRHRHLTCGITHRIDDVDAFNARIDGFYAQYKAGTLDPEAHLRFVLSVLAGRPATEIGAWHQEYLDTVVKPAVRDEALQLVRRHLDAGDLCAIVTATNAFVTRPIAALFGVSHLLGAEGEQVDGVYTGEPQGVITFQGGKLVRIHEWLADQGTTIADFDEVWADAGCCPEDKRSTDKLREK